MLMLHGFVDRAQAGERGLPDGLPRLAPDAPIAVLDAGPLAMLASDLRVLARAERSLQALLENPERASALAVAHNRVLCVAVENADILPVRFGSMLPAEGEVARRLAEKALAVAEQFEAVRGAAEYAVRLVSASRPDQVREQAAPATGRAYLAEKLKRRQTREDRQERIASLIREIHSAARDVARDIVQRPLGQAANSGRAAPERAPRYLDLALLVARDRTSLLSSMLDQLSRDAKALNLEIEAIGPWPPFHFADAPNDRRTLGKREAV